MSRGVAIISDTHGHLSVNDGRVMAIREICDRDSAARAKVVAFADGYKGLHGLWHARKLVFVVQVVVEHCRGPGMCENVAVALLETVTGKLPVGLRAAGVMVLHACVHSVPSSWGQVECQRASDTIDRCLTSKAVLRVAVSKNLESFSRHSYAAINFQPRRFVNSKQTVSNAETAQKLSRTFRNYYNGPTDIAQRVLLKLKGAGATLVHPRYQKIPKFRCHWICKSHAHVAGTVTF